MIAASARVNKAEQAIRITRMAIAVKPKPRLDALRIEEPFTVIVIRMKNICTQLVSWPCGLR